MRVLFLSPQLPWPPVSGARMRVFYLLRAAASAHAVDLLSFAAPGETAAAGPLRALCGEIELVPPPRPRPAALRALDTLAAPLPDLAERLWSAEMARRLRERLAGGGYDLLHVCGLEVGRYLSQARGVRAILDEFNVEHALQRGLARADTARPRAWPGAAYSALQAAKLARFEATACRRADLVLAVSEADAAGLARLVGSPAGRPAGVPLAPGWTVHVVPNGVDTTALRYRPPRPQPQPALLFTGTMDYRPNADAALWLAREVLPLIRRAAPAVRLFVVGHRPPAALVALGKCDRALAVTGSVPDLDPYWDAAAVYVLPMRTGGGVRFKAMEALALGLPLVSTSFGMQGLDAEPGRHYLRADRADEFAAAVLRLLSDADLRARLAPAGRALAEERFDWRHVAPRLLRAYASLAPRAVGSRPR